MFHVLHRIYVLSWVILSVGAVVWLYPRTGISEPLLDWYAVWQNEPGPTVKPAAELSGAVVRVVDGSSFTLRTPDRQFYTIGLLGITVPALKPNSPAAELEAAERSKAFLSDLILSNQVEVAATGLDPQHRGVGIVHLGQTNVNAAVVQSGLVQLRRDFIKGLPWRDQYILLRADRKARETKTGAKEQRAER
jgi:endonuclease YncB( thermonuclease family)